MILRLARLALVTACTASSLLADQPVVEALHHFRTTHVVPAPGLVRAGDGNYYGVTTNGGTNSIGSVFRLTAGGQLETVYSFKPGDLNALPAGNLALGPDGALYGVPYSPAFTASIFRVTTAGDFQTFGVSNVGGGSFLNPLVLGPDGALYGSARDGGANSRGTIFRFTPTAGVTWIYSLPSISPLGQDPLGRMAAGPDGYFYGAVRSGHLPPTSCPIYRFKPGGPVELAASIPTSGFSLIGQGSLVVNAAGVIYGLLDPLDSGVLQRLYSSANGKTTVVSLLDNYDRLFLGLDGSVFLQGSRRVSRLRRWSMTIDEFFFAYDYYQGGIVSFQPEADGGFIGLRGSVEGGGMNVPPRGGAVFRVDATGDSHIVATFPYESDGASPRSVPIVATDGAIYGTTSRGGAQNGGCFFRYRPGVGYEVLASFERSPDLTPVGNLVEGKNGEYFGVTDGAAQGGQNSGSIFRFSPERGIEILGRFKPAESGYRPLGLVWGTDGKLYGVTAQGGANGGGAFFSYSPDKGIIALASFDETTGLEPCARLIRGDDGNFYGSTLRGGGSNAGTVFRANPSGEITRIASFESYSYVSGPLVQGNDGSLYGTTRSGGRYLCGTYFRASADGKITVLHDFGSSTPFVAKYPSGGLIRGQDGFFYGTTAGSANNHGDESGVVYRVTDGGLYEELGLFYYYIHGGYGGELVQALDGSWCGLNEWGGSFSKGALIRISGINPSFIPSSVEPDPPATPEPTPTDDHSVVIPNPDASPAAPVVFGLKPNRPLMTRSVRAVVRGSAETENAIVEYRVGNGRFTRVNAGTQWVIKPSLKMGRNLVLIRVVDRDTGRRSEPVRLIIVRL